MRLPWVNESLRGNRGSGFRLKLPDYLSDLNAMHEVEKVLTEEQRYVYYDWLLKVCGKTVEIKNTIHATAAHRAEAFLRTLNLWTE